MIRHWKVAGFAVLAGRGLVVMAALFVMVTTATGVMASTIWKRVAGMKPMDTRQVAGARQAVDGKAATSARLTARTGQPAVLVLRVREGEILKGIRLNMGPLAKGGRCTVEYAWNEKDWHRVWYIDGPHSADVQGFGFDQWPAAQYLRLTFENRSEMKEITWRLQEIEVYAEE